MSHLTRITGEIAIDPPLRWGEFKHSPFLETNWTDPYGNDQRRVKLRITESTEDTEDGTVSRITADALLPATDEPYRSYGIVFDVDTFGELYGAGRTFTGHLHCEEEGYADDIWRLGLAGIHGKNLVAFTTKAAIVWPEDLDEMREALSDTTDPGALCNAVARFVSTMDALSVRDAT